MWSDCPTRAIIIYFHIFVHPNPSCGFGQGPLLRPFFGRTSGVISFGQDRIRSFFGPPEGVISLGQDPVQCPNPSCGFGQGPPSPVLLWSYIRSHLLRPGPLFFQNIPSPLLWLRPGLGLRFFFGRFLSGQNRLSAIMSFDQP